MKKVISLLLALVCAFSAFTFFGCGGNKDFDASITLSDKTVTYDGQYHNLEVSGELPDGTAVTYKYDGTKQSTNRGKKAAGEYTVTADLKCSGYNDKTLTAKLTITESQEGEIMLGLEFLGGSVDYDGNFHKLEVSGEIPTGAVITYTYNEIENVDNVGVKEPGTYAVEATVECEGYRTKVVTATLMIRSGSSSGGADAQKLDIWIMNAGYGTKWLTQTIALFKEQDWVKTKYPNLQIPAFDDSGTATFGLEQVISGTTQYDLVFPTAGFSSSPTYMDNYSFFLDLTDGVYNSYVPGENILFKDKMVDSLYQDQAFVLKNEGNKEVRYGVPWVNGTHGFIYNETTMKAMLGQGYELKANTTDQFFALLDELLVHSSNNQCLLFYQSAIVSYFTSLAQVWEAQYDGVEAFHNLLDGKYLSDTGEYVMGPGSIDDRTGFGSTGRLEALKALEKLVKPQSGYLGNYNTAWGSLLFNDAQKMLVIGQGPKYVFTWNGDWFDNETKSVQSEGQVLRMMRTPVLSSIVDVLEGSYSDEDLSDIIDLVDQNLDFASAKNAYDPQHGGDGSLIEADYDKLCEARNIKTPNGGHQAFIPNYSPATELAQDFLRFMGTDEAIEAQIRANGGVSVYDYDLETKNPTLYATLSKIQLDHIAQKKDAVRYGGMLRSSSSFPLAYYANVSLFSCAPHIAGAFATTGGKSAEQAWQECCYDDATFDTLLKRAGLK